MDGAGIAALAFAGAATLWALWRGARSSTALAVIGLVLAGAALRINVAAHRGLGLWDERFHALVALHLVEHPLEPTLVERPLYDRPPSDWPATRVWLQKPPFALWLMALSRSVFGEHEFALRISSVLLGSLGVAIGYALARDFVGRRAALAAAAFQAWHGRSALLAGGLFSSDHVDSVFAFLVELGVWLGLRSVTALGRNQRAGLLLSATGLVLGIGWLTMSALALVIPGVVFLALLRSGCSSRICGVALATILAVAACVVLPWELYCAHAFPEAFAHASGRNLRHLLTVVEGHAGAWTYHLANLPRHYGALTWIPLAAFTWLGLRRRRDWIPLLGWLAVTYAVFSAAATKMPSYVLMAAPVIFIALGWFCAEGAVALGRRGAMLAVGSVVGAFVVSSSWNAQHKAEVYLRDPTWAAELRWLAAQVDELADGPWLIFGVDSPIECMFYTGATCRAGLPRPEDLAAARERGFRLAVYGDSSLPEIAALKAVPGIELLGQAPSAVPARRLLAQLRSRGLERAVIFNAANARDLEELLKRSIDVRVFAGLPRASRMRPGDPVVALLCPGDEELRQQLAAVPQLQLVEDAIHAAPSGDRHGDRC